MYVHSIFRVNFIKFLLRKLWICRMKMLGKCSINRYPQGRSIVLESVQLEKTPSVIWWDHS